MTDILARIATRAILVAVLFVPFLETSASAQLVGDVGIPLGTTPDPLIIEDLDGNPLEIANLAGKPVLLEFWATWCEQCEALLPTMRAAYDMYREDVAFVVVAVGVGQSLRSVRRHIERHDIPFPHYWDAKGQATRTYSAPTTSYIVILDADGKVAYTGVGPQQDLVGALGRILSPTD